MQIQAVVNNVGQKNYLSSDVKYKRHYYIEQTHSKYLKVRSIHSFIQLIFYWVDITSADNG